MKFNAKKWDRILHQRADLHRKLMAISEDLDFQRRDFSRQYEHFIRSYTDNTAKDPIVKAMENDKKASSLDIENRLHQLKNKLPIVCELFDIDSRPSSHRHLVEIYQQMLEFKLMYERKELAAKDWNEYSACFNVLEEFAKTKVTVDRGIHSPVIDATPEWAYQQ